MYLTFSGCTAHCTAHHLPAGLCTCHFLAVLHSVLPTSSQPCHLHCSSKPGYVPDISWLYCVLYCPAAPSQVMYLPSPGCTVLCTMLCTAHQLPAMLLHFFTHPTVGVPPLCNSYGLEGSSVTKKEGGEVGWEDAGFRVWLDLEM